MTDDVMHLNLNKWTLKIFENLLLLMKGKKNYVGC